MTDKDWLTGGSKKKWRPYAAERDEKEDVVVLLLY